MRPAGPHGVRPSAPVLSWSSNRASRFHPPTDGSGSTLYRRTLPPFSPNAALNVGQDDGRDARCFEWRFNAGAVSDNDDGKVIQIDVLLRYAEYVLFSHFGYLRGVLLVIGVGQPLRPKRDNRAVHALDCRKSSGQTLDQRILRRCKLLVRDRSGTSDAPQFFHELDQCNIALRGNDVASRSESTWALSKSKGRIDTVAVPLLLTDVGIKARLKHSSQHRVHHLKRVVVGCAARRTWVSDREGGLRRARFVDKEDGRGMRCRKGWIGEGWFVAALRPGRKRLFDGRLCRGRADIANHRHERSTGLEIFFVKR